MTPPTLGGVAKTRMKVSITFRLPEDLRDDSRDIAKLLDDDVSDILRDALEAYVRKNRKYLHAVEESDA